MENKIMIIKNVRGYQDNKGVAQLNTEDIARGLGFTEIANSGNEVIRWRTVRGYLNEFNVATSCDDNSPQVGKTGIPEYIPENIFYKLCFKAKNEIARRFQDIVTDEILPAIRQTGGYIAGEENMNEDELILKAMNVLNAKVEKLRQENKQLEGTIEKQKPKVLFADSVETSKTSILVGELAKILKQNGHEIGQNRLFQWLRDNDYLISRKGTDYNMPTQKAMNLGLFQIKETSITHSDGHVSVSKTTKVTGKGQIYFVNKFTA